MTSDLPTARRPPASASDPLFSLVEAAALHHLSSEKSSSILQQNSSSLPGFSSLTAQPLHHPILSFAPAASYAVVPMLVIPSSNVSPAFSFAHAPSAATTRTHASQQLSHREQALQRYKQKRDRRRQYTILKGGKALAAETRPRDARGLFAPETSVSEQISEIRRRIQENESANSQMRHELQKKMAELESIRKQNRDIEATPPSTQAEAQGPPH